MTSTKVSPRSNLFPWSSCRTQTPGRQANFTLAISNRFDALSLPDDVQVLYSGIVSTIQNATEEVVGKPHSPLGIYQIRGPCPPMQCGQVLIPIETHHSLKTMVTLCHEVCEAHEEDDHNYLATDRGTWISRPTECSQRYVENYWWDSTQLPRSRPQADLLSTQSKT